MLSLESALDRIHRCIPVVETETVFLADGWNRVVARNVTASKDLPPFHHATVDGFAVQHADVKEAREDRGVALHIVETIQAGFEARKSVRPGQAIGLMTGAPLPSGATAVVKREHTASAESESDVILIRRPVGPMENVARAGEAMRRGDPVARKGSILRPETIGPLASLGLEKLPVFKRPEVAVLSTGSELVEIGNDLRTGQIFASSFYVLLSKVRESGCIPLPLGVVPDDRSKIRQRIRSGLVANAIVTVGGTRRGETDWVRPLYKEMGISLEIDGVAVSPGSSFAFGTLGGKPIFSLPGSPTASTVAFEMLVRPSLLRMKGLRFSPNLEEQTIRMTLKEEVRGKGGLRSCVLVEAVVACGRWVAVPIKKSRRGSLVPMIRANGIAVLPPGELRLEAGREVNVRPIDGSLW